MLNVNIADLRADASLEMNNNAHLTPRRSDTAGAAAPRRLAARAARVWRVIAFRRSACVHPFVPVRLLPVESSGFRAHVT